MEERALATGDKTPGKGLAQKEHTLGVDGEAAIPAFLRHLQHVAAPENADTRIVDERRDLAQFGFNRCERAIVAGNRADIEGRSHDRDTVSGDPLDC